MRFICKNELSTWGRMRNVCGKVPGIMMIDDYTRGLRSRSSQRIGYAVDVSGRGWGNISFWHAKLDGFPRVKGKYAWHMRKGFPLKLMMQPSQRLNQHADKQANGNGKKRGEKLIFMTWPVLKCQCAYFFFLIMYKIREKRKLRLLDAGFLWIMLRQFSLRCRCQILHALLYGLLLLLLIFFSFNFKFPRFHSVCPYFCFVPHFPNAFPLCFSFTLKGSKWA